ncbi:MAG: hypothetical protein HKN68_01470 [Saprospiraceae bacterium]|nr:hypothetical protein [Saprospiraceae bacterium]
MNKYMIMCFLPLVLSFLACNQVAESNYQETIEYHLYMNYLDQVAKEDLKFYIIDETLSKSENEALKQQKRMLESKIDEYIKENNLYFSSEPTEMERLEFLNLINDFIDSQTIDEEIRKNVKKMWSLNFNPLRDELRKNFLKASGLKKEDLLTVYQNRIK